MEEKLKSVEEIKQILQSMKVQMVSINATLQIITLQLDEEPIIPVIDLENICWN